MSDIEKHKRNIIEYLHLKENARKNVKCPDCWHGRINCVCQKLPRFRYRNNTNVIVYMDSKEMYNCGDDGKLLMIASPEQTSRYIYGMEDDELVAHLESVPHRNVIVLFPSEYAISFPDWIATVQADQAKVLAASPPPSEFSSEFALAQETELTVIVVDAVWRHARRMATRLRERLPDVRHVQLTPEQMSVYARKQTQPDRICTVEATALFLSLCGEAEITCDAMVNCVRINNEALKPGSKSSRVNTGLYADNLPHPAWYLGINMVGDVGDVSGKHTKQLNKPKKKSRGRRYM